MEAAVVNNNLELFKASCPDDMRFDKEIIKSIIRLKRYDFMEHICKPGTPRADTNKMRFIYTSCRLGDYEVFTNVSAGKIRCNKYTYIISVAGGSIEIVSHLTEMGALSRFQGTPYEEFPVRRAIENKHYHIVKYLLDHRALASLDDTLNDMKRKGTLKEYHDILRYTHDLDVGRASHLRHHWGCPKCVYCDERKKEMLSDYWIMETEVYDYTVQWLPNEMIEDTLMLF